MKRTRWTPEELERAAARSTSVGQVLIALGLVPEGGNYRQIQTAAGKRASGETGIRATLKTSCPLDMWVRIPPSPLILRRLAMDLLVIGNLLVRKV